MTWARRDSKGALLGPKQPTSLGKQARGDLFYPSRTMSNGEQKQTKAERQAAAREAREQAEQASAADAARKKRIWQIGGVAAIVAVVIAGVAIATTSGGGTDTTGTPNGADEVAALFQGVPLKGNSAGNPKAPITLVEFADLKCPVCQKFDVGAMPEIIRKYVQTGKVRIELRLLHFVGSDPKDTEKAARFAVAAGLQDREWPFAELFYYNQQDEATNYVTDDYLKWLSKSVKGLNADKALSQSNSKTVTDTLDQYAKQFAANGFTGTPSFLIGSTGGKLNPLVPAGAVDSPASFTTQIDAALQSK